MVLLGGERVRNGCECRFTIADLSVTSVLSWVKAGRIGLASHPNVERWLRGCLKRPAQKAALALP